MKTVTTPLIPRIVRSQTSFISNPSQYQNICILATFFAVICTSKYERLSTLLIYNVVAHEGQLFPLKVGNSEKLITLSDGASVQDAIRYENTEPHHQEIESVATVMDQINGSPEDSDFPFPVNGKIWVIALNTKSSALKMVTFIYYSEKLNAFIPLNRPEDSQVDATSKSSKTLSFKLLN